MLPVTRNVAVQIEALFSPKGASFEFEDSNVTGKLQLDYLDIPVRARIDGARSGGRSMHVFGGPLSRHPRQGEEPGRNLGSSGTSGFNEDVSSEIERFDLGLLVGAGVDLGRIVF